MSEVQFHFECDNHKCPHAGLKVVATLQKEDCESCGEPMRRLEPVGDVQVGNRLTEFIGGDRYLWTVSEVKSPKKITAEREVKTGKFTVTLTRRDVDGKEKWCVPGRHARSGGYWVRGDFGEYMDPHF